MDDDNEMFELFLSVMAQVQPEDPDGRMRVISKNPRYTVDDPAVAYPPPKHIKKRGKANGRKTTTTQKCP